MAEIDSDAAKTTSLEKGLMLLGRILHDRGCTPISELAKDIALPRSTLYRLMGTLEQQGLVTRIGRGRFDIGLVLVEAASEVSVSERLAHHARPWLRRLALDCRAAAHLGVLDAGMVTYLVKVSPRGAKAAVSFTQENIQLEAYCSGIGKVLLANLPTEAREKYMADGPFVALTKRTITDPQQLRETLAIVRRQQFARDEAEIADGLYCVAAPIRGSRGTVIAAISLSFATPGLAADPATLQKLQACAEKISASLRGQN